MTRKVYKSDLTDQEWRIIEPLIPPAKPGGHPRTVDMLEVINAIFYSIFQLDRLQLTLSIIDRKDETLLH